MATNSCCHYFVRFVVFTLVIVNIVSGILTIIDVYKTSKKDSYELTYFESEEETLYSTDVPKLTEGVASVCLGFLLLYGATKKNAICVLIYLVLATLGVAIVSFRLGYSVLSSRAEVNGVFIVIAIMITLVWGILYFVYLFYRELSNNVEISKTSKKSSGLIKSNTKNETDTCSV